MFIDWRSRAVGCGQFLLGLAGWICLAASAFGEESRRNPFRGTTPGFRGDNYDYPLFDVSFADSRVGWAVGAGGTVLRTDDGGRTWRNQNCGVTCQLNSVGALDSRRAWICGGFYEPYSRISRGVFLWTSDAGETWEATPTPLPRLRGCHFKNSLHGIAFGDWSARYQASVFTTHDGGKSWYPDANIDLGPIRDIKGTGVEWLRDDQSKLWMRKGAGRPVPCLVSDSIEKIAVDEKTLFAAGNGQLWCGIDQSPRLEKLVTTAQLPPVMRILAPYHERLLVAGFPAKQSLLFEETVCSTPIPINGVVHAATWIDSSTIVAVGSFGSIAISSDGGKSWQVSRGEGQRCGTLLFARNQEEIPWMLIAQQTLQHNHRICIVRLVDPNESTAKNDPLAPDPQSLAEQIAAESGASEYLEVLVEDPRTELRIKKSRPSLEAIVHAWNPVALAYTEDLRPTEQQALLNLVTTVNQTRTTFPIRLYEIAKGEGPVKPNANRLEHHAAMVNVGKFAKDYQQYAQSFGDNPFKKIRSIQHRLVAARGGSSHSDHWLSGINPQMLMGTYRRKESSAGGQYGRLQVRTEFPRILTELTANPTEDPARYQKQLRKLLAQLHEHDREAFVVDLLDHLADAGHAVLWQATLESVDALPSASGLRSWGVEQRNSLGHSAEWQRIIRQQPSTSNTATEGIAKRGSPFEANNEPKIARTMGVTSVVSKSTLAAWSLDSPRRWFAASNNQSSLPSGDSQSTAKSMAYSNEREQILQQIAQQRGARIWSQHCRDELQGSTDGSALSIVSAAGLSLTLGSLEEKLWRDGLREAPEKQGRSDPLRLAYNAEFLFISAKGMLSPVPLASARRQDESLDEVERLVLEFDVDRDLATAFRLEIDAAGRVRDSCDGFLSWNPIWYAKVYVRDDQWCFEGAIRREDLVELPPIPGDFWRVRWRVVTPHERLPVGPALTPDGWEIARFE